MASTDLNTARVEELIQDNRRIMLQHMTVELGTSFRSVARPHTAQNAVEAALLGHHQTPSLQPRPRSKWLSPLSSLEWVPRRPTIRFRWGGETLRNNVAEHARIGFLPEGNIQTHPTKRQVPKLIWRLMSKNNLMYCMYYQLAVLVIWNKMYTFHCRLCNLIFWSLLVLCKLYDISNNTNF